MKFNFSTNYEEMEVVPEGIYEVFINSIMENTSPAGTLFIDCQMKIRKDVQQPQQGRIIFHQIWRKKNPDKTDFGEFSAMSINMLCRAIGVPDNTTFTSYQDFFNAVRGRMLKVEVGHEEYNGQNYARVKKMWMTEHPADPVHIPRDGFVPTQDDNIPF